MKRDVILVREYAVTPERLWRALTDANELGEWLMKNDFKAEVGHRFHFRAKPQPGWDGVVHCQVTEVSPPHRLSYSWNGGDMETRVTWTLAPTTRGTQLRLEHCGFVGLKGIILSFILGSGWKKKILPKLDDVVTGRLGSGSGATPECEHQT